MDASNSGRSLRARTPFRCTRSPMWRRGRLREPASAYRLCRLQPPPAVIFDHAVVIVTIATGVGRALPHGHDVAACPLNVPIRRLPGTGATGLLNRPHHDGPVPNTAEVSL
jgi:hypothetical protein